MIAAVRRSLFFALRSGIPLFAPDMVGERSRILQGDKQKSPSHGLSPEGGDQTRSGRRE
jgi:hypothetical protein